MITCLVAGNFFVVLSFQARLIATSRQLSLHGYIYIEPGAFTDLTGGSDHSIVIFHDPFANSQADPRAFILIIAMQTFKYFENALVVLIVKTNTVVLYTDAAKAGALLVCICPFFDLAAYYDL